MTNGCTGLLPEPLACCAQSAYGQTTSPDVDANATCANGYEPGSIWIREDTTPYEVWIMNACPQDWVCISGCDTELYHFQTYIDTTAVSAATYPNGDTTIQWRTTPTYNYPGTGANWDSTDGEWYQIPEDGIYQFAVSLVLDLRGLTIAATSDFVIECHANANVKARLSGVSVFNETSNEFLQVGSSQTAEFNAGDFVTFHLLQDSGVTVNGVVATTSPSFVMPQAGMMTIDQLA